MHRAMLGRLAAARRLSSGLARTFERAVPALSRAPVAARPPHRQVWWSHEKPNPTFPNGPPVIDEDRIHNLIESTQEAARDVSVVKDILEKAKERATLKHLPCDIQSEYVQGLSLEEAATLLNIDSNNAELMTLLGQTARDIKSSIYGNRVVLFAPLYLSNYCVNNCTYCGYRAKNKEIPRSMLTLDEVKAEVETLQRQGHRRLLLLVGEHPKYSFDDFMEALCVVRDTTTEPFGDIRRINVEIPALSVADFKRLKAEECVGTYTLFQETYHRETFERVHPGGPKSDFDWRLETMDRAHLADIDDVGIGALFGLYDFRFEVLAMMMHSEHLENAYGSGPHTISVPRLRPASNAPDSLDGGPFAVNDGDFKKLVATIRCAVPYTGMILSTRESQEMRHELLSMGVSQMSAGSHTDVGSYSRQKTCGDQTSSQGAGQFSLQDTRDLGQVVEGLMEDGFCPSWCTACYRLGRTGEKFMKIAKKGAIHNFCHPNALTTLQEYLVDYGDDSLREKAKPVIDRELKTLPAGVQRFVNKNFERIDKGKRDICI